MSYSTIDNTTGEVFKDRILGLVNSKRRHPFANRGFIMINQGSKVMYGVTRGITHRVWHVLKNLAGEGNLVIATHEDVAKELGTSRPQVSIAMKELEALDIIQPYNGKNGIYTLHIEDMWKGDTNAYPVKSLPSTRSLKERAQAAKQLHLAEQS